MDKHTAIAKDALHELFTYDNGLLRNKISRGKAKAGSLVGTLDAYGYLVCQVNKRTYKVHRLIYSMFYDEVPDMLDHINGNCTDNRIENLRPVNHKQNGYNSKLSRATSTGIKGVSRLRNKWIAQCQVAGKRHYLGVFDSIECAQAKLVKFRAAQHKEFARNG